MADLATSDGESVLRSYADCVECGARLRFELQLPIKIDDMRAHAEAAILLKGWTPLPSYRARCPACQRRHLHQLSRRAAKRDDALPEAKPGRRRD